MADFDGDFGEYLGGKSKKSCNIMKYIERESPKLYAVMDELCFSVSSRTGQGRAVTFLMPDASYVGEIVKMADSDTPEVAGSMLRSLVLPDRYATVSDFETAKNDVVNLLHHKVDVKSVSAKGVEFGCGCTATPDAGFIPFDTAKENFFVWSLSGKGRFPTEGERVERKQHSGSKVKGGARCGAMLRCTADIESSYREYLKNGGENPYEAAVDKIMSILAARGENDVTFQCAASVLDQDPLVSYYLLVEPHKDDDFFIPSACLEQEKEVGVTLQSYRSFIAPDNLQLRSARKALRDEILVQGTDKMTVKKQIQAAYEALRETGSVKGVRLYSDAVQKYYASKEYLRQWQDEFRFIVGRLSAAIKGDVGEYDYLCLFIKSSFNGKMLKMQLRLSCPELKPVAVPDASEHWSGAWAFARDTSFLYVPVNDPASYGPAWNPTERPDATSGTNGMLYAGHIVNGGGHKHSSRRYVRL